MFRVDDALEERETMLKSYIQNKMDVETKGFNNKRVVRVLLELLCTEKMVMQMRWTTNMPKTVNVGQDLLAEKLAELKETRTYDRLTLPLFCEDMEDEYHQLWDLDDRRR
jgi:hypothetical protein